MSNNLPIRATNRPFARARRFGCILYGHMWVLDRYDTATHFGLFVCRRCDESYLSSRRLA